MLFLSLSSLISDGSFIGVKIPQNSSACSYNWYQSVGGKQSDLAQSLERGMRMNHLENGMKFFLLTNDDGMKF